MRRRAFMAFLGGAVLCPAHARAQPAKIPRIGFLISHAAAEPFSTYFREGLREFGYGEGRNVHVDVRVGENPKALADAAAAFVRQKVAIIATVRTAATEAAKQATSEIPIVITLVADAVDLGLVASLAKPGRNVTGVSANTAQTAGKTLELTRELMPAARRVAVLVDSDTAFGKRFLAHVQRTAKVLGIEIRPVMVPGAAGMKAMLPALTKLQPHAAILQPSLGQRAAELVMRQRIPAVSSNSTLAGGCVMTYSADIRDTFHKAAGYVDRILKGARPADLPVEEPTKFELVINRKAARTLGITIPPSLLVRADRLID